MRDAWGEELRLLWGPTRRWERGRRGRSRRASPTASRSLMPPRSRARTWRRTSKKPSTTSPCWVALWVWRVRAGQVVVGWRKWKSKRASLSFCKKGLTLSLWNTYLYILTELPGEIWQLTGSWGRGWQFPEIIILKKIINIATLSERSNIRPNFRTTYWAHWAFNIFLGLLSGLHLVSCS